MITLRFYLLSSTTAIVAAGHEFAAIPGITWGATPNYWLAAVCAETADHATFLAANAQPGSWTGTVGDARAALRSSQALNHWWIFDAFMANQGISTSGQFLHI